MASPYMVHWGIHIVSKIMKIPLLTHHFPIYWTNHLLWMLSNQMMLNHLSWNIQKSTTNIRHCLAIQTEFVFCHQKKSFQHCIHLSFPQKAFVYILRCHQYIPHNLWNQLYLHFESNDNWQILTDTQYQSPQVHVLHQQHSNQFHTLNWIILWISAKIS